MDSVAEVLPALKDLLCAAAAPLVSPAPVLSQEVLDISSLRHKAVTSFCGGRHRDSPVKASQRRRAAEMQGSFTCDITEHC